MVPTQQGTLSWKTLISELPYWKIWWTSLDQDGLADCWDVGKTEVIDFSYIIH